MRCFVLAALTLLAFAPTAKADLITLYNTGVNAGGSPLAGGSIDPHWSIIAGSGIVDPVSAVVLNSQSPQGLYAQSPASRWIWVSAGGAGATNVDYTFRLVFDMTGLDPETAQISGSWGVDNNGSIALNGSPAIGTGALSLTGGVIGNFSTFHAFSITGGFVPGINTIDFLADDDANPGALNVTGLSGTASAIPEPTSVWLACLGLAAHACSRRRRATA